MNRYPMRKSVFMGLDIDYPKLIELQANGEKLTIKSSKSKASKAKTFVKKKQIGVRRNDQRK